MSPLLISLASCWVLCGATVAEYSLFHANLDGNDKIFTDNITFESNASTSLDCARQCGQQESCMTFTYHQNTCRGHSARTTSHEHFTSVPGALSYTRKTDGTQSGIRCEKTGVKRVTDASLGLDMYVYCQDDWLVIQKRQDGSVDFNRNWQNYTAGFGDVHGEYWLGLEPLHLITTSRTNYELRVDMTAWNGTSASSFYSNFYVGPAARNYMLEFDSFVGGTAGNSLRKARGRQFTTLDADNDVKDEFNCAQDRLGGWWFKQCGPSSLNGKYKPSDVYGWDGIIWFHFTDRYSLKSCQMMVRRAF